MRNKYRAVKTVVDGIKFDSKAEARRYSNLKILEGVGDISDLELQPRYDLVINGIKVGFYKADFRYIQDGDTIVEDVKGMKTPIYNLKKKMIKAIYGIDILETK
tara:strand:- start:1208 stop:1519 length:312 start_codon:yes stop_codon:yes gene_type:complete